MSDSSPRDKREKFFEALETLEKALSTDMSASEEICMGFLLPEHSTDSITEAQKRLSLPVCGRDGDSRRSFGSRLQQLLAKYTEPEKPPTPKAGPFPSIHPFC
jgi:hypothetical protein